MSEEREKQRRIEAEHILSDLCSLAYGFGETATSQPEFKAVRKHYMKWTKKYVPDASKRDYA